MVSGDTIGFIACGVATLFFGSYFIPVKKFDAGDGFFFQWVLAMGIWIVGLTIQGYQHSPHFEPYAMVGGMLWCLGNTMCVPAIKLIGLGLGMLIWGGSNLFVGWASGRFGLMGIDKNTGIEIPALNVVGVIIALLSLGIYFFVKTEVNNKTNSGSDLMDEPLVNTEHTNYSRLENNAAGNKYPNPEETAAPRDLFAPLEKLSPFKKQIIGFTMAIIAGCFFGLNFNPPQYLMDHAHNSKGELVHSTKALDYVFSHFSGVLVTATALLFGYCGYMKNQPVVNPQLILPGIISGVMWGIAQVAWFVANENLEFVVTFPIISTGPGVVASLYGVLLFGEIKGKKNISVLLSAFAVTLLGISLITISKTGV